MSVVNKPAATPPPPALRDALDRARAQIEARALEPLTLAGLADWANVSPYHFARQFTARFGVAPMTYLRGLRLTYAAARLRESPRPSLVQLAFECGFDSQEGFTRAFSRAYGVPPGRYRSGALAQEIDAMSEAPNPPLNLTGGERPEPRPAIRVAGLSRHFSREGVSGVPALWMELLSLPLVAAARKRRTFGVCRAAPDGQDGVLYTAAIELGPDFEAPPGLEVIDLAARSYLVYRLTVDSSDLHDQMQASAREIWGRRAPGSGFTLDQAPDLEVYPAGFEPGRAGAVLEWWIPARA